MQLTKQQNKVVNRGVEQKYYYSVANSPKIMEMLGNFLYSDKVLAPIRELTTNAIDSHVVAGTTDKPIKYKLPTVIEETPTFSIRDHGEGMPEDKLVNMYRVYGLSSKDDDDLQQGAYGLGSKSPFAYTDSFTTISYYNGKKYIYINSKSVNGVPTLNKMGEYDTDEPNGIEISFPVKFSDITDFELKLNKVLKRCPIPYECNIELDVWKNNNEVLLEGNNWKLYNGGGKAVAIMGYIEYPINPSFFYGENNGNLLNQNIEMYFDIGDIEMDISREKLQYNEKTISAINDRLKEINDALYDLITEKVSKAESLFEARTLLEELKSRFYYLVSQKQYVWNNQTILSSEQIVAKLKGNKDYENIIYLYNKYGSTCYRLVKNMYLSKIDNNLAIIIDDLGKGGRTRGTYFLKTSKIYNKCLIFDKALEQQVLDLFGLPKEKLFYLSKLPSAPRVTYTRSNVKSYPAKVINVGTKEQQSTSINKKMPKQYYLVSNRGNIRLSNGLIIETTNRLRTILLALDELKIYSDNVYLVIPSKENQVKSWGWENFETFIRKEIEKLPINKRKLCLSNLHIEEDLIRKEFFSIFDKIPKGPFKKYLKFLHLIKRCVKDKKIKSYNEIKTILQIKNEDIENAIKNNKEKINIEKIHNEINKRYPLITYINDNYYSGWDKKIKDMTHYISLIDG